MALKILHNPDARLRLISEEVSFSDLASEEIKKLIQEMIESMKESKGVGLAAPQIGMQKRIIIVDEGNGPRAYANPRITKRSFKKVDSEEGCLSVPNVWGIVRRHKKVQVKALDQGGKEVVIKADGLLSIIFQHEIDHLDGVLFIDRVEHFTHPSEL